MLPGNVCWMARKRATKRRQYSEALKRQMVAETLATKLLIVDEVL
jgi:hypothetical protein